MDMRIDQHQGGLQGFLASLLLFHALQLTLSFPPFAKSEFGVTLLRQSSRTHQNASRSHCYSPEQNDPDEILEKTDGDRKQPGETDKERKAEQKV
jgi:hypothetical protein